MKSRSNQWGRLPGGSWGIVGLIVAALALWMLTGAFSSKKPEAAEVVAASKAAEKFHVMIRDQSAEPVRRAVVINGNTMPDQIVNLSAQVEGQVVAIGARKGTRVKQGDLIAKLDSRDLEPIRLGHTDDVFVPVDPETLSARLEAVGFGATSIDIGEYQFRFVAPKP